MESISDLLGDQGGVAAGAVVDETPKPKFEDLTQNDFIAFREENIFGYDPPAKI